MKKNINRNKAGSIQKKKQIIQESQSIFLRLNDSEKVDFYISGFKKVIKDIAFSSGLYIAYTETESKLFLIMYVVLTILYTAKIRLILKNLIIIPDAISNPSTRFSLILYWLIDLFVPTVIWLLSLIIISQLSIEILSAIKNFSIKL